MDDAFLETLARGADTVGVPLSGAQLQRFSDYHRELLLWNRRINLISETSAQEIALRHFVDSLTAYPWIARPDAPLIDLGSGAGFPGLPLKIASPSLPLTLVESSRKKCSFLAQIARVLALDGITVLQERIEVLTARADSGRYETVVSRAAFKLPELVRLSSFFLVPGGRLIAMKGPEPGLEIAAAEAVLAATGMALEARRELPLPFINTSRNIVIYKRTAATLVP